MDNNTPIQAVPEAIEDNSQVASPPTESAVADTPVVDASVEPTSVEPTPEEALVASPEVQPESQPSRLDKRLEQLQSKGQNLQDLTERLTQLRRTPSQSPIPESSPTAPKLSDLVQEGSTLMPDDLDKLGQRVYEEGAQNGRGISALEIQQLKNELAARDALRDAASDTDTLPVLYSELDPRSSNYNSILEKKIAEEYQTLAIHEGPNGQIIVDPSVRLSDVAKREVNFFREAMETGKMQTSAILAQQASEGALTPDSSSAAPEPEFEDLSLDQMEARLRAQGRDI